METKEYKTIDRVGLGWPSGPWDAEPDKVQWPDADTGLPCLAVRHPRSGHWCGYVGVAEGHPYHGKGYDDTTLPDAHWGLTYADACQPGETESKGVCHVPAPGEPEHVWWFGFDCAHCDDWSPQQQKDTSRGYPFTRHEEVYRDLAYVRRECAALARQLLAV